MWARARVVVRETDISRWVYVYVRVGVWEAVILCIVAFCRRTDLSVHLPVQFNLPLLAKHIHLSTHLLVYQYPENKFKVLLRFQGFIEVSRFYWAWACVTWHLFYRLTTFVLMLSFRLNTKTHFSIQLFVYMPIDAPVHQPTCSFGYFHSD